MKDMNLGEIVERSVQIRELYHELEKQYHGKEWSVERCVSFPDRCRVSRAFDNVSAKVLA